MSLKQQQMDSLVEALEALIYSKVAEMHASGRSIWEPAARQEEHRTTFKKELGSLLTAFEHDIKTWR